MWREQDKDIRTKRYEVELKECKSFPKLQHFGFARESLHFLGYVPFPWKESLEAGNRMWQVRQAGH